ncbi:MAG: hypothetical protein ACJ8R9_15650 [Steroidobacteraceae bacterium]
MTDIQSAHASIPLLKSNEEQLAKIRRQLEGMFRELRLIQDVIMVCGGVRESSSSDLTVKSNTSCVAAAPIVCSVC